MDFLPHGSAALIAVFAAFYLLDCIVLLQPGQAILHLRRRRVHRRVRRRAGSKSKAAPPEITGAPIDVKLNLGLTYYPLRGRYIAFLNPLTPFVSAFKTVPLPEIPWAEISRAEAAVLKRPLRHLLAASLITRAMTPLILCHAVVLCLFLPLQVVFGGMAGLLATLGFAFLSAGIIIVFSRALRPALGISKGAFWSLAAQSLLCLPLSLNFPRKLGLLAMANVPAPDLLSRIAPAHRGMAAHDLMVILRYAAHDESVAVDVAGLETILQRLASDYPDV